ncbi:hypothetical protein LINPERPRIM_LOCUS2944 [Linum perenne]
MHRRRRLPPSAAALPLHGDCHRVRKHRQYCVRGCEDDMPSELRQPVWT